MLTTDRAIRALSLFFFLLLSSLLCPLTQAHSILPERLARVDAVVNPTIAFSDYPVKDLFHSDFSQLQPSHSFLLRFTAFDMTITLHLDPNPDLFHPHARLTTHSTDIKEEPLFAGDRVYKGWVISPAVPDKQAWARITFHQPEYPLPHPGHVVFEGAFQLGWDIYHIKATPHFHISKRHDDPIPTQESPMVIYRDSDIHASSLLARRHANDSDFMCAMEEMQYNQKLTGIRKHTNTTDGLSKRDDSMNALQGCPSTRRIAYMGAAADCTYVGSYGGIRYARLQMINDWNVASAVYERTFNVSLGLIYMHMSLPQCPKLVDAQKTWNQGCSSYYTINDRLSDFSLWRGNRGDDGAALWHLMTKCSTGVKVGIAWLSQLCETQVSQQIEENGSSEWVSGAGVSSITRDEWKVVAHEIGHGFGAIHDCTPQSCPCKHSGCSCCPLSDTTCSAGDTYLMNPTSNVTTEDFSPCSINDICGSFPNIGYCLQSPNLRTTNSFAMCGNGILEPGEECDSGSTDSACCHAKTCKLKSGAKCDDYSEMCCLNCTVAPSTAVCRPAVSECDISEYCTGQSTSCPADEYEENGTVCGNSTLKCASGVCTSRDEQCIARGLRLSVTEDCPFQEDSCQVSCADPLNPGNCLVLSGVFLDGTECGLAGFCEKGKCISTGALNTLAAWVAQNKQIAIPVFLFGSLILLGLLGWLAWFAFTYHRRRRRLAILKHKSSHSSFPEAKDIIPTKPPVAPVVALEMNKKQDDDEAWELRPLGSSAPPARSTSLHRYNLSEGNFVPVAQDGGMSRRWGNNNGMAGDDEAAGECPTGTTAGRHRRVKSNA
ncbi:Metallo-peptidase family M12-domain-containing protein [Syncephalastrum racemosum]|uniref:Disintegrin and metalloproteinase domain-containing protein B n=1 Tax=Syncephalastrum racemosum TaxID=13706 RepID=A0A1X2GZU5_SYNRA|nr:Metallo-peptidase family M12-domain-containing protein [Syncephalastrum racemosum]